MARTPLGEVLRTIGDGLGSPTRTHTSVPADGGSYALVMQPAVQAAIEHQLQGVAARVGAPLRKSFYSPGTLGGSGGVPLHNTRWNCSKGMGPGFTVSMRHEKKNVRLLYLTGRPTYPLALVVGLAMGAILEAAWFPWISENFSGFFRGSAVGVLYFIAILVSIVLLYWLILKTTNILFIGLGIIIACGIMSIVLSYFWGFIAGYLLGWWVVTWSSNKSSGFEVRAHLAQALAAATQAVIAMPPPVYIAPPVQTFAPPPPMGRPGYAPAYAPAAPPRIHPPPATAPVAPAPRPPAPPPAGASYPCPTCGNPVPDGAPLCGRCGAGIVWQ